MRLLASAGAIALAASISVPVFAADSEGRYAIEGPGRTICADFTADADTKDIRRDVAIWLSGYITAHNRLLGDTFDITPWQSSPALLSLTRQFCLANPDATVEVAAQQLMSYLAPDRLTESSDLVAQGSGNQTTVLYAEVVSQARGRLRAAGFDPGNTPAALAEAVKAYQRSLGTDPSGILDQATLARLFAP